MNTARYRVIKSGIKYFAQRLNGTQWEYIEQNLTTGDLKEYRTKESAIMACNNLMRKEKVLQEPDVVWEGYLDKTTNVVVREV